MSSNTTMTTMAMTNDSSCFRLILLPNRRTTVNQVKVETLEETMPDPALLTMAICAISYNGPLPVGMLVEPWVASPEPAVGVFTPDGLGEGLGRTGRCHTAEETAEMGPQDQRLTATVTATAAANR
jgi:hypothetical protein